MEDAHDVKIGLKYGLHDWSYFAVFDGHAGKLSNICIMIWCSHAVIL